MSRTSGLGSKFEKLRPGRCHRPVFMLKIMTFRPYIFIETSEQRPSSIAVAGWTANQMKYIDLPEFFTSESLPLVKDIVRAHFSDHQGKCHLCGDITGYRFVLSPTESIILDVEGNEIGRENGKFWPRSITRL